MLAHKLSEGNQVRAERSVTVSSSACFDVREKLKGLSAFGLEVTNRPD
jgi:hypothetical protein